MVNYATLINHYIPGAFYPYGGPGEIAFQIIPIIERYGGRVITDAPVTDILINSNGRAQGMWKESLINHYIFTQNSVVA